MVDPRALRKGTKVVHTRDGSRCEVRDVWYDEGQPPTVFLLVEDEAASTCSCGCDECCPIPPVRYVPIDEVEPV